MTFAGLNPANRTAVSPIPRPNSALPFETSSTVAIDPAVTVKCLVIGFASRVPRLILEVLEAADASNTYVSCRRNCESGTKA